MKLVALILSALVPALAHAETRAPATVRGYFAALEHKDFSRALSLTTADATGRTERMVARLRHEAAQHHADFELKVRALSVAEQTPDAFGAVPVDVRYDIDVIGKKWIFKKVARHLTGTAQFLVDADHIVAILGNLE